MPKYGYKYLLYQYDKNNFPFPYSHLSHAYASDYREAFVKLITLADIKSGSLQQYFIGHYRTRYPKSAQDIYNLDMNGILKQLDMYRASPTRSIANTAAKMHRRYYAVGRRNGESAESVRAKNNAYQREYVRKQRKYNQWRDIIVEITGCNSDIPLWRDRITDEPWEDDPAPTIRKNPGPKVIAKPFKQTKQVPWKSQSFIDRAIPRPYGGKTSFLDDEDDDGC